MKKEQYFLVKTWHPHRGTTAEKPACYFYGSYIYHFPLEKVRAGLVYTSRKRAENVAARNATIYTKTEVIEIPAEMIID